jgi:Tol biopolymer transport system component
MARRIIMLILLVLAERAQGQSVFARGGNIYLSERGSQSRRITASGHDREPSLSRDGRQIVFVRVISEKPDASGLGTVVEQSEIDVIDTRDPQARIHTILNFPVEERGLRFYWFSSPQFSDNGRLVYFLVPDYGTVSPGLFSVSVAAGEIRFVAPALQFWAPASKEYPGDLVVRQNPMLVGGGRYDVYNLITSTGEQVGVVGFDESRLQYFLKEFGTPRN